MDVTLAAVGALVLLATAMVGALLRSADRGALFVGLASVVVLFYGAVRDTLLRAAFWPNEWGVQRYLLPVALLVLAGGAVFAARTRRASLLVRYGGALAGVLAAVNLATLAATPRLDGPRPAGPLRATADAGRESQPWRDVYHLILDSYARDDVLRECLGAHRPTLADDLATRGFHVSGQAISNYASTALSLASTFGMDYLRPARGDSTDWSPVHDAVENSRVMEFFSHAGYHIAHFRSGKAITNDNRRADVVLGDERLQEFGYLLLRASLLGPFVERALGASQRATTRYALRHFPDPARRAERPTFTFAHVLAPHPPYLFTAAGGVAAETSKNEIEAYLEQARYVQAEVIAAVDEILARNGPAPVIIVHSDHGPAFAAGWDGLDPAFTTRRDLVAERMPNLVALYLPDRDAASLVGDRISNVNIYRVVLSAYFGLDLPRLPDRSLFSDYLHPYELTDVTGWLDDPAPLACRGLASARVAVHGERSAGEAVGIEKRLGY